MTAVPFFFSTYSRIRHAETWGGILWRNGKSQTEAGFGRSGRYEARHRNRRSSRNSEETHVFYSFSYSEWDSFCATSLLTTIASSSIERVILYFPRRGKWGFLPPCEMIRADIPNKGEVAQVGRKKRRTMGNTKPIIISPQNSRGGRQTHHSEIIGEDQSLNRFGARNAPEPNPEWHWSAMGGRGSYKEYTERGKTSKIAKSEPGKKRAII